MSGSGRGWAVLQFPLTRLVIALVSITGLVTLAQLAVLGAAGTLGIERTGLAMALLVLAAALPAPALYVGYVRIVERRRVVELATDGLAGDLGTGFALGLGLCTTTVLVLLIAQVARIELDAGLAAVVPALLFAFGAALAEEILFRGVMFRIIEERLGSWIALAISAAIFGTLHLLNEHASAVTAIAIALEAGVLLGASYMFARRLWLPIAIHAGWNFGQLGIFGVPGSGPGGHGFWAVHLTGPSILTGGDYGPDGSIVAVLACLALALGFVVLAHRRGHVIRPFWTTRSETWTPL
ncbi:MAG: CPBP family intramembrane glutamic endopeptidase [Kofleriaceae bacterium]